jgi:ferredoxin-NADP reductase
MEGATALGRLIWQPATIREIVPVSARAKTIVFDVEEWPGHRAGQHVDIRLTAEDGYQAARSYSIASPPESANIAITVEAIEDGEVSPYLTSDAAPGDRIDVRGPIGGYFIWETMLGGPLLLVGGGSGVVPLLAMIRHRLAVGNDTPVRLLYSARSADDVIYVDELTMLNASEQGIEVIYTYTRLPPPGWAGFDRRIDADILHAVSWPLTSHPRIYVCGPTSFVETAATALVALGHDHSQVKTERFGPSSV